MGPDSSMKASEFKLEGWVEQLARALQALHRIQDHYTDELDRHGAQWSRGQVGLAPGSEFRDLSGELQGFYWRACHGKSRFQKERYGPIRAALAEVKRILAAHPAWSTLVNSSSDGEIWLRLPNSGGIWSPSDMIGGLMARSEETGESGFRVACSELSQLLEPLGGANRESAAGELLIGYHVVLLQGLSVGEDIRIGDGLMIVPFELLGVYFDARMLEKLAPGVSTLYGRKSVAAIVKPFRWEPEFCDKGDDSRSKWGRSGSFFEDAEAFVELLALFHAAPIVRLATVPRRLHRTACLLLGEEAAHRSYSAGYSSWSRGRLGRPVEARREAIDDAARAFADRSGERYRACAPVIARLAEALARRGPFQTDDRILDVAIALEQMYELDQGEISFKLKMRAACFLKKAKQTRLRVFRDVEALYKARSAIVHNRGKKKQSSKQERKAAFESGFDVARQSVVKLLTDGPPPNWNEMVLDGVNNDAPKAQGGAGTTEQGYRNRNGQTVIRRTDSPGNDHNQVVYELECDACGCLYGANGSGIWQRKCPKCGGGRPGLSYS